MYTPKTDEEIATIAKGMFQGTHFSSLQIDPNEGVQILGSIFLPLAFMKKEQLQELVDDDIVHFYGKIEQGARAINGYPCMFNMGILNKNDAQRLYDKFVKIRAAVEGA